MSTMTPDDHSCSGDRRYETGASSRSRVALGRFDGSVDPTFLAIGCGAYGIH